MVQLWIWYDKYSLTQCSIINVTSYACILGLGLIIYMAIAVVRLVQLTDYIQGIKALIMDHTEYLVDLEAMSGDASVQAKARKYVTLYSNFRGISVHGFFTIDRQILIKISSYVLTFVIILVEFKLNDLKET